MMNILAQPFIIGLKKLLLFYDDKLYIKKKLMMVLYAQHCG